MNIVIIGSGIAGMSAAIEAASKGINVTIISPLASERAQSVMAAGGINGVIEPEIYNDSIDSHVEDTYKGGCFIEDVESIKYLCNKAPEHIKFLESIGVVFSRDDNGNIAQRAFGGQSHRRTAYAGSSTGKQIMTGLIQKCREYEKKGIIKRVLSLHFHSALIEDGKCYGVLMVNSRKGDLIPFYADAVIIAAGGQNMLFGKTTGTQICDGYTAARLFTQGVKLRNLEFIQYHPTTIETSHKRMLITEAARGEGGRLYYEQDGKRVYFMEEMYGEKGNLMPRDVVSRCIYNCPSQVYLDITFLGEELIHNRLEEIYDLCLEYINLDVTKESIPVYPSVHFFMGGIAVNINHETNVKDLYAVGECASMYHGANRLGGNSLLAAVHSGREAALHINENVESNRVNISDKKFDEYIKCEKDKVLLRKTSKSKFPAEYILKDIASVMNKELGISREESGLKDGLEELDFLLTIIDKINFDKDVSLYDNLRLKYMIILAKAIILSALARKESRGAHYRSDYPESLEEYKKPSYATYNDGQIQVEFE